jgi:hypothetical protein
MSDDMDAEVRDEPVPVLSKGSAEVVIRWYGDLDSDGIADFVAFDGKDSEILFLSSVSQKSNLFTSPVSKRYAK